MNKFKKLLAPASTYLQSATPLHWADLGCGSGVFTEVLASLLPPKSNITAIDRTAQHLPSTMGIETSVNFITADFETDTLSLSDLDGIMMANAFHFVQAKERLILKLEPCFRVTPQFLIVEYEHSHPNAWEPFPIPFKQMKELFKRLNYKRIEKLGSLNSVYGGTLYACFISKK